MGNTNMDNAYIIKCKIFDLVDFRSRLLAQFVYEKNHALVNKYATLKVRSDNTMVFEFDKNLSQSDLTELQIRLSDFNLKVKKYNNSIRALNQDISEINDSNALCEINKYMAECTSKSFNNFFISNNSNNAFNTLVRRGVLSQDINVYALDSQKAEGKINIKNTEYGKYCLNKIKEKNDSYLNSAMILEYFANSAKLNYENCMEERVA